ncbi:[protein-PII] uridylyltransferase [Actomonas aquatica]|uniref:Bifunctional uridylyltransferase/uridylyl-removing enzyme n=1 Tax=Actomonas aquatica TaxID=2866162 RepID=A0ABZ1CCU7_9BACT|nr:[protein-PII] uridylyltransferase [Opitutus sp. WL0086]WRQ89251.1 [protein-PII] uridylyltransferase [Opitutus sp. WL0086]
MSGTDSTPERLRFTTATSVADRTKACKSHLQLETSMIKMRHDAGATGLSTAAALSAAVDTMLVSLFQVAIDSWEAAQGKLPCPVTLVALGGYGRAELCPHSDIDLMFLFPSKARSSLITPLQEHLTQEILYPLWDCGLKVGHSSRTVDEVFNEARAEIQSKTALLESRRLAGSKSLYETFSAAYRKFYTQEYPAVYIATRLEDQLSRRDKYGNSVFLQEPDIKNGVGGLRDYQNTIWMARVKLDIDNIEEVVTQNYLRAAELKSFQHAYDFLLRVRNELHFQSRRPTDVLDLEAQPRIALGLGYTTPDILRRVELFMRDYYRAAQEIYRTSKLVENRLALTLEAPPDEKFSFREVIRSRRYEKTKRLDGFILRAKELSAASPDVFQEDPVRLVRIFRHSQRLGAQLHFDLQALIREHGHLITADVIASEDANTSFKAILQEPGSVYPALSLMHELGILGRFIPEFDGLTCLVQHEFYHRYTADIHTLNTIRELDRILSEDTPIVLKYRKALRETSEPMLLYLILLLHDIGKARGIRGHAENGVKIAEPLLQRLHIGKANREIVAFIIQHHLMMARFWQKRDVDDPATAEAFSQQISEPDLLRFLYVHTYCDAQGTASGLWNSYKDTLHTQLYRSSLEHLIHGDALAERQTQRIAMIRQELIAKQLPHVREEEIEAHFNLLPDRYFLNTTQPDIVLHLGMVNRLLQTIAETDSIGSLRPVVEWRDDLNRSLTVVHVVTWDRAGLFYKLAGAFSVAGLSILSSKVVSRNDHIAIDTFFVTEPGGGVVENAKAQKLFNDALEKSLMHNKDLLPEILRQAEKQAAAKRYSRDHSRAEMVQATFPPRVDIYHELSMHRTIVEIQAPDQIGLLFRVAKTISEHKFDITFARVGTERHIAIDSFYIVDVSDEAVSDANRLHTLRDALTEVVSPPRNATKTAV